MSPIFILDNTSVPARYGITASLWANRLGLPLWSLRPDFAGDVPDSHQHVIRAGYCVTSGLWRSDTLREEVRDIACLPESDAVIVLASSQAALIADLPGQRLFSDDRNHRLTLSDGQHTLLDLTADRYGRWDAGEPSSAGTSLRIALIGRESDHRLVYPATLGSLGDAAASLGLYLDVHFFAPVSLSPGLHVLHDVQGVVLPGGSSMAAVKGQIRVAEDTLARGQPTLGLCLGMQSMMTAVVRRRPGCESAIPAEVAPDEALHSFVPFVDGRHRCGVFPFSFGLISGDIREMHYNHRYCFNTDLLPALDRSGVSVSAQTDDIVEAISQPELPFWHGVQGHPELMSRPDAPHPLFVAFLRAALNAQA
ncbi:CTP synthase [Klebsiella variicola subsp. tropica]|uniref:glutamine amidotransferase-related protein n=1 Tax=Klebsiella variicola TaxID=244366 RepID=UPI0022834CDC|nr:CTP synthase [Klebsiella variicola]WAL50531.1 CTP synthase [Klebsiella variicola subsp. tropica]